MPIENRNLSVGTRLVANYKKQRFVCTLEAAEGGEGIAFVLEDGTRHKSPSAAGSKVMGGKAVNGWRFWTVDGDEPQAEAKEQPKQVAEPKAVQPKAAKAKKLIYRLPNQHGVAQGKTKFWCNGCMKSFVIEGSDLPEQCPEGHRSDDPELTAPVAVEAKANGEETDDADRA